MKMRIQLDYTGKLSSLGGSLKFRVYISIPHTINIIYIITTLHGYALCVLK